MRLEINRIIAESSILFVSIFATIGLLIGATINEFKWSFIYLGYMLYYALPFILAAFWAIVSMLSTDKRRREARVTSYFAVAFFLTGLMMLIYLASAATQTVLLPTHFVFLMTYQSVSLAELFVTLLFLVSPLSISWILAKVKVSQKWQQALLAIFIAIFLIGIFTMTIFGINQTSYMVAGSAFLSGSPDYELKSVNITLQVTDQIIVEIKSIENQYLNYAFLDEKNYDVYTNSTTRTDAKPISTDIGSDISFKVTIEASGEYFLAMKSEYFQGNNVTYSIKVYQTNSSVLSNSFLITVSSASIFVGILIPNQNSSLIESDNC
jgi:hypothetical protein